MNYRSGARAMNRVRFAIDRDLRMSNLTDRLAQAWGKAPALSVEAPCPWLGVEGTTIDFEALHDAVARLTTVLRGAGLRRFGRVAIYRRNNVDYFIMGLAVMRAGGIAVPVHGELPAEAFRQYAAYTGCEIVYTDDERLQRLDTTALPGVRCWIVPQRERALATQRLVLDEVMDRHTPQGQAEPMSRHDDALIVHTSGTTGFPKGVLHSSDSLIHSVRVALVRNPIPSDDKAMLAAHLNHHISFTSLMASCMTGTEAVLATTLEPGSVLDRLSSSRATVFFAFPDVYQAMIAAGLAQRDLPCIRYWISGGDAMHEAHIRLCVAKGSNLRLLGLPLRGSIFMEMLGTSEMGSAALIKISTLRTTRYDRFVGRQTLIGPRVKVADAMGRVLPPGEPGRLMVKGRTLFKGYWNLHERLHEVMVDGWWWTGDVARTDPRGRIYHLDREVDVVQTLQGPVFGLPIEERLLKLPDVGEAVVLAVDDEQGVTRPVAVAHSLSGAPLDTAALQDALNAQLEPSQRLHELIDVGHPRHIPRGLTGKVLKRELRERLSRRRATLHAVAA